MSKNAFVGTVSAMVLILDQLSKCYIRATVPVHSSIPIIASIFHITHVHNTGGAFSFLADAPDAIRIPFFLVASAVAIAALIYFVRQIDEHEKLILFALAGILGGAVGNLVDRVWFKQVTDFLDVHFKSYYWPAFNVADSFISVGVTVLLIHSLFASGETSGQEEPS